MDHYLLREWLAWWQAAAPALLSAGFSSFEKNAGDAPWRDVGNVVTATGGGWAATRDGFFDLIGAELPAEPPESGGDAVRDTVSSFVRQAIEGIFGGSGSESAGTGTGSTGESSGSSSGSTPSQPSLADLLPADMGGRTTLSDVVEAGRNSTGD